MQKAKAQTYNDGVVSIYSVGNIAEPGNMPKDGLVLKLAGLRFEERTVGIKRFWEAQQANVRIDRLIRTPRIKTVSSQDIAVLPDGQYKIKQVQYPPEEKLSMDLSLERLEADYEIG